MLSSFRWVSLLTDDDNDDGDDIVCGIMGVKDGIWDWIGGDNPGDKIRGGPAILGSFSFIF